jgi:hypothetical protein
MTTRAVTNEKNHATPPAVIAAAVEKTKREPKHIEEFLRYDFTEEETRQKAKDLALALQMKERAESEKKAVVKQFEERIETQASIVSRVSREIYAGWEMRNIKCSVEFHTPTPGAKRITRLDTGELVAERAMESYELQECLKFDENEEAPV